MPAERDGDGRWTSGGVPPEAAAGEGIGLLFANPGDEMRGKKTERTAERRVVINTIQTRGKHASSME